MFQKGERGWDNKHEKRIEKQGTITRSKSLNISIDYWTGNNFRFFSVLSN